MCVYDTYADNTSKAQMRRSKPQNHDSAPLGFLRDLQELVQCPPSGVDLGPAARDQIEKSSATRVIKVAIVCEMKPRLSQLLAKI